MKALIVESDQYISVEMTGALRRADFDVKAVCDPRLAQMEIMSFSYHLLVLEHVWTSEAYVKLIHDFRKEGGTAAILTTSSEGSIDWEEIVLDAGADDFFCRPFRVSSLVARAKALVRHCESQSACDRVFKAGHIALDRVSGRVTRHDEEVHLFPMEYLLLEFLMRHPNESFSSAALCQRVWKDKPSASSETVRTHIKTLRQKLQPGNYSEIIKTEHRKGYRLVC